MDNEAKGCYDKIVPPHNNLCYRRLGLTELAEKMLDIVLINTVFYLRTGHRVLSKTYCSAEIRRILGTGQGNGASPCIWMAILDNILWSIAQKDILFSVQSPSGKEVEKLRDTYVDDTALMYVSQRDVNRNKQETRTKVTEQITHTAQDFEKKLICTGGEASFAQILLVSHRLEMGGECNFEVGNKGRVRKGNNPHKRIQYGKITIERFECAEAIQTI